MCTDTYSEGGLWGLWCFNALSDEQQQLVVEEGYLPMGRKQPEQLDRCDKPAVIELAWTVWDRFPGPRFYCTACAIKRLAELQKVYES